MKLQNQGFLVIMSKSSFRGFYGRNNDLSTEYLSIRDDHGYVPFIVVTIHSFPFHDLSNDSVQELCNMWHYWTRDCPPFRCRGGSCCSILSLLCSICRATLFVLFVFQLTIVLSVLSLFLQLTAPDYPQSYLQTVLIAGNTRRKSAIWRKLVVQSY
jgi:hypothetical protein